jgi:hypothetical protein
MLVLCYYFVFYSILKLFFVFNNFTQTITLKINLKPNLFLNLIIFQPILLEYKIGSR